MHILKFGGTSVGSPQAIEQVVEIVRAKGTEPCVVVVSAFSGVTDALIEAAVDSEQGGDRQELPAAGSLSPTPCPLPSLKTRHEECARYFLTGERLDAALAEIGAAFAELESLVKSVAILKVLPPRTLDMIMSFGERLSAFIIAQIFRAKGLNAEYLDSRDVIKTDTSFGAAKVLREQTYSKIKDTCKKNVIYVAGGFIGSTENGETTTLGRGGSDLSAAVYAAAFGRGTDVLEIWTDVNGVLSADPKIVHGAFTIKEMPYIEAMEMSHFGAKVLHPPTIQPVLEKNIPIRILNTFDPAGASTLIHSGASESDTLVRGISSISDVSIIRVQGTGLSGATGFASRLFGALARRGVSLILITQASSEYSICFAVKPEDAENAVQAIKEDFRIELKEGSLEEPEAENGLSIIAVVGSRMKHTAGIAGRVFHALGRSGVNVIAIAQGSSEINISAVVPKTERSKAMNAIHEAFFLSGVRSVNLFLVGLGLIGGTLLEQITAQSTLLADKYKIRVRLAGLANSRKMIFDENGIDLINAKSILESKGEPYQLKTYISKMKSYNLPNIAFCDCTASEDVALMYKEILHAHIPVVTPNKKANSGALAYYNEITGFSRDKGVPYLYEVTVCAGLPVISSLRDLYLSGDRVLKIEAVLSGTLSFIFNSFTGGTAFSALVRDAKAKGYTEPDPRDDLNAMDAARKALILARECGMPLEFSQVKIEPIVPEACFKAASVEAFFTELEKSDAGYERRRAAAAQEGKALRYIATVEAGKASLSLRAEPPDSPFRSLRDADNIVVITSERYNKLPMVIKGPGAGAQVTAGGVFADIVRIARTLV
jgi:aspartokinase/homoserine dehydrogenase 1